MKDGEANIIKMNEIKWQGEKHERKLDSVEWRPEACPRPIKALKQ